MRLPRALLVLMVALMLVPEPAEAQKPRAERPQLVLGDKWIRNDGAYELVRMTGWGYVFVAQDGREIYVSRDLWVTVITRPDRDTWSMQSLPLRWPLHVGQSGKTGGHWGVPESAGQAEFEWTVEAYEDVRVPAGTFKAFRIRVHVSSEITVPAESGRGWFKPREKRYLYWVFRTWYAPEVRQYVKATGRNIGPFAFQVVAIEKPTPAPLRIFVQEPGDQTTVEEAELKLGGRVTAGTGVRRVAVSLNGTEIFASDEHSSVSQQLDLDVPLTLREGRNVVIVTAADGAGDKRQEARVLFFDNPVQVGPAGTPVRVRLMGARRWLTVPSREVLLTGTIWSDIGLREVIVSLDGHGVLARSLQSGGKAATLSVPVTLGEGDSLVRVLVVDAKGSSSELLHFLNVSTDARPPAVPAPEPALGHAPSPEPTPVAGAPVVLGQTEAKQPQAGSVPTGAAPAPERHPDFQPPPAPPGPAPEKSGEMNVATEPPGAVKPPALVTPLKVTLSAPGAQARVNNETVALAGMVSGGRGIAGVVVTVNGVEVSRRDEKAPQRAVAVNLAVKLREGQNTIVVTATGADGALEQEIRSIIYERDVPLTITVRYPDEKARVTDEATIVAAVVTSSKGVAVIRVMLNGSEVSRQEERGRPKSLVVTAPLKLRDGANVVAVSAEEPDGTVRQEIRTVFFDRSKVVTVAPSATTTPAPKHDRWAVVIGVGEYQHPEIPRLRYTVPDADAIYQSLVGSAGFKKEHVLLLTDRSERKPTLRNIKWALGTFLARSAKKDDTVLIFFAGHGAPEIDQRGVERDGLAKYLVPADADPDDLYATALPMDELQTIFGRIEAERVLAFLDSCYSGAAGGRTFTSKKTRSGYLDDLFLERLTRSKGRVIVTASRPSEVSIELTELGHGIFTYYLIRGLEGAGDLNRDGIVSLQELYEYVEQKVREKSRAVGANQHPVMKGELEGVLPLIKVRGQ